MYNMHEKIDQDQNSEGFANNPTNLIGKHLIIPSNYQWYYPNYLNSPPNIINKYQEIGSPNMKSPRNKNPQF